MELNASLETSLGNNPEREPCQLSGHKNAAFRWKLTQRVIPRRYRRSAEESDSVAEITARISAREDSRTYIPDTLSITLGSVETSCPISRIREITRYGYTTHLADPL